jgi:hypothetical protein
LSAVPKLAGQAVDRRWNAPHEGPVKAELSPTGLALDVDVSQVDPAFNGLLSMQYKSPIPEAVLTAIPRRSLAFDVPVSGCCAPLGSPLAGPRRRRSPRTDLVSCVVPPAAA